MGKKALAGQPGVIDVTMAFRSKPFREWTMVYFDPEKTDEATLLERLRTHGCRKADRDGILATERKGYKLTLQSRITVPGGLLVLSVTAPEKGNLVVRPPKGWAVPRGAKRGLSSVVTQVAVQVPKSAPQGFHPLEVEIDTGETPRRFKLVAEVVRSVK